MMNAIVSISLKMMEVKVRLLPSNGCDGTGAMLLCDVTLPLTMAWSMSLLQFLLVLLCLRRSTLRSRFISCRVLSL